MKVNSTTLDKLSEAYAEALLQKFNEDLFWEKPWFDICKPPVNLRGTGYNGTNLMFLSMIVSAKGYGLPVFMTFNQAKKLEASVMKGQKGYPVQHYIIYYLDAQNKYLSEQDFEKLSPENQKACQKRAKLSSYTVFNVEQTDMKDKRPELYQKMKEMYRPKIEGHLQGEVNGPLDDLIEHQKWICPIQEKQSNQAFYSPSEHRIVLPLREQFFERNEFYATALHEMAHSTKHPSGVGRQSKAGEGVDPYGHEELIAELSAGLTSLLIGIEQKPQRNNLAYLKSWINGIKQDPHYIFNCLADAKAVSKFMCGKLGMDNRKSERQEQDGINVPKELLNYKCKQIKL